MELQELEELMRDLLQAIQLMVDSGEDMSDELQGAVAETLELLFNRISELRGEAPPEPPENIRLARSMPSSNVHSFGYDDKTNQLLVRFQGDYPDQNGPIYGYEGVPKQIFDLFRRGAIPAKTTGRNAWGEWWKGKVPSLGASLSALIKNGGYPYNRLT